MEATRASTAKCRSLAFACLIHVGELYYEHLQDYMKDIYGLTMGRFSLTPEEAKRAASEFWSTLARMVEQSLGDQEIMNDARNRSATGPPALQPVHQVGRTFPCSTFAGNSDKAG